VNIELKMMGMEFVAFRCRIGILINLLKKAKDIFKQDCSSPDTNPRPSDYQAGMVTFIKLQSVRKVRQSEYFGQPKSQCVQNIIVNI
jgi:hypothetical protein